MIIKSSKYNFRPDISNKGSSLSEKPLLLMKIGPI